MPASIESIRPVNIDQTCSGAPGIVDLWFSKYGSISEIELANTATKLISNDESKRWRALKFERDRILYLVSRLLVRSVLSAYTSVSRKTWQFRADPYGKPHIIHPHVTPTLHFNISHTHGLAVCAVSVAHDQVGVDVEHLNREISHTKIAEEYFSHRDASALVALPADEQPRRFFELWTLRESYAKARGLGLSFPFVHASFSIGEPIGVIFDPKANDIDGDWSFEVITTPESYLAAIAVKTNGAPFSPRVTHVPIPVLVRHDD